MNGYSLDTTPGAASLADAAPGVVSVVQKHPYKMAQIEQTLKVVHSLPCPRAFWFTRIASCSSYSGLEVDCGARPDASVYAAGHAAQVRATASLYFLDAILLLGAELFSTGIV